MKDRAIALCRSDAASFDDFLARFPPAFGHLSQRKGNDFGEFGAATGAIDVGNELWVNSFRSDQSQFSQ